jgi:hypothetical protein
MKWPFASKKKAAATPGGAASVSSLQQWLAVCTKLTGGEFGNDRERDAIRQFAGYLEEEIQRQGVGVYDGDEFGNREGSLYLYGPDADRLYDAIEPLLRSWDMLSGGYVIKRYGSRADSERIEF